MAKERGEHEEARAGVALLALVLIVAACSSDDEPVADDSETTTPGDDEPTDGEPVEGGTFVVGLGAQLPAQGTLNPAVSTQGGMQQAAGLLFSGLVEIDENAEPVPELATEWEILDDGATYVFTLAEDVVFHDGEPLTAEDVKWSYEAALLRHHARTQASIGPALEEPCAPAPEPPDCPSIEAVEASGSEQATVTFRFARPYGPLLQQLTHTDGAILPKHIWEGEEPPTAATPWPEGQDPVGTGPFRFASHDASEIVFERNPEYFRDPEPYLDRVVQRAVEPAAQAQALANGEIDWLWGVSGQDLPALESNPDIEIVTGSQSAGGSTNCVLKVVYNLFERGADPAAVQAGTPGPHPILGDLAVRQAIAQALDTDVYVEQVLQGNGELATSPISSQIGFAHTDAPIGEFDREEARQLLDEAGWTSSGDGETRTRDGQPLVLDMFHFTGSEGNLATKMSQDLAEVGIEVQLQQVDAAGKNSLYGERGFDTMVVSNCQGTDPEIGVRRFYHTTAITGAPFTNGAGYSNAEVDTLFDDAAAELDPDTRGELYADIQEQLAADLPYLWLLETVAVRAHTVECEGLRAYTGHFLETAFCDR
ncbi:ABC transporter substrate-binding protein [soil metagenome]